MEIGAVNNRGTAPGTPANKVMETTMELLEKTNDVSRETWAKVGGVTSADNQVKGSTEMLRDAVVEANKKLAFGNSDCEFRFDRDVKRVSIKVINRETKEVIREIPSEEAMEMIKKLHEMTGLLVDERL